MARVFPRNLPLAYARDHVDEVLAWDAGAFGFWIRAFHPAIFPGIPASAAFGFASNGTPDEDTGTSPDHAPFSEITAFGIPAPPWNLRNPNTDTSVQNAWFELHADPRVRALLRRPACMAPPGCWRPAAGGLPDATAVGLVMLADELAAVSRRLDPDLRPTRPTLWVPALYSWAWSAGSGRAATQLQALAPALRGVPESRRFVAAGEALARALQSGALHARGSTYDNPGYAWLRTAQKLWMGAVHAALRGRPDDLAFFVRGFGDARTLAWIERVLARAASGYDPRQEPPPPSPAWPWALPLLATGAVGATGFALWRSA